jgi:rubrerythrin
MGEMNEKTLENLKNAFAGESQAHMKYLIYAEEAKSQGLRNIARIFEALAYSEYIHARNHLKIFEDVKNIVEDLDKSINGETYEVEEMYPAFYDQAINANEKRAATSFRWALETEKGHAEIYKRVRTLIASGRDKDVTGKYFVCSVCGYTIENEAPDVCPVCSAGKAKFRKF